MQKLIPIKLIKIKTGFEVNLSENEQPDIVDSDIIEQLILFLTPSSGNWEANEEVILGLYLPRDITPYMHVLIYHAAEMMRIHKHWGLKAFSCSAIEKKNHQQVSYFFRKTLKYTGKNKHEKSAIKDLLDYKNRNLYFSYK
ncbi:22689_t:CDS:2 [Gigaspora rosea]|nr:22689_t:CDS:2 [Gigaspora rosea]